MFDASVGDYQIKRLIVECTLKFPGFQNALAHIDDVIIAFAVIYPHHKVMLKIAIEHVVKGSRIAVFHIFKDMLHFICRIDVICAG